MNIHPTKTEIKFENEQAIWQILSAAVKESLGKFNAVPSIDFDTEGMLDIPAFEQPHPIEPPKVHYNTDFNPFKSTSSSSYGGDHSYSRPQVEWESLYAGLEKASRMNEVDVPDTPASEDWESTAAPNGNAETVDTAQGVLFPEIVQFPASEVAMLEEILDDLSAVGFELTSLGGGSYAINGVPAGIEGLNPVELVRNMVHTALEKGSDVKEEVQSMLALTLARAAAIVYGQVLGNEEMSALVDNLFACESPNYTPDGRVVLATLKEEEIERLFAK